MSAEIPLPLPASLIPAYVDGARVELPGLTFTRVWRYSFTDALNTLPEIRLELSGTAENDVGYNLEALIGQPATVHLEGEAAVPRFDGIVRRAEYQHHEVIDARSVTLVIVPALWLTTQRSGHRIFQQRSTLEIVQDLLAHYSPSMSRLEGVLFQHVLPAREYRVQCGESDHDFLFRLLSEEGLVSLFSPNSQGDRLWIVTDDTTAGGPDLELHYWPPDFVSGQRPPPGVFTVESVARLCPSHVRLRDYTPRHPLLQLDARTLSGDAAPAEEALETYSFAVGRFGDTEEGMRLAGRRLEAARTPSRTYRWKTTFAARAGMTIRLSGAMDPATNGDFLVVSSQSEVDGRGRKHVAEVVPAATPWRPPLLPKPRIQGTQTAFVTGAPGKEIDVDAEGRIAVRFHWDTRPDGASRRVRVSMPWAGRGRGFWTLPRVGDEVVIGYLDGDPDEPLVVGSVNNATAPIAIPLPEFESRSAWVSRSTPGVVGVDGYNYIIMEDAAGKEFLALRAERDFECDTRRNSLTKIGGSGVLSVVQGHSVQVGGDVETKIAGKCHVEAGNVQVDSKGNIDLNANGCRNDSAETFHYFGSPFIYVVGKNEVQVTAQDAIKLTVGGSSITITDGKITIVSPLIEMNP